MRGSKCSKLLKSEMICVQRDYSDIHVQMVALYKINATESRLESDPTFIVNTEAMKH